MNVLWPNFGKRGGLVTVVVQHADTKEGLMVASANELAFRLTLATGIAHYWSTSRDELWKKGETSGNDQQVVRILVDCDGDSVIYQVIPQGPACHTGNPTCFYRDVLADVAKAAFPTAKEVLPVVPITDVAASLRQKGTNRG